MNYFLETFLRLNLSNESKEKILCSRASQLFIPFHRPLAGRVLRKIFMHHDHRMHCSSMHAPGFSGSSWTARSGAHARSIIMLNMMFLWRPFSYVFRCIMPCRSKHPRLAGVLSSLKATKLERTYVSNPTVMQNPRKNMSGTADAWCAPCTQWPVSVSSSPWFKKKWTQASDAVREAHDYLLWMKIKLKTGYYFTAFFWQARYSVAPWFPKFHT